MSKMLSPPLCWLVHRAFTPSNVRQRAKVKKARWQSWKLIVGNELGIESLAAKLGSVVWYISSMGKSHQLVVEISPFRWRKKGEGHGRSGFNGHNFILQTWR